MSRLRLLLLPLLLTALLTGCSGGGKGNDNDDDQQKELQRIENILSDQEEIGQTVDDMLAVLDTASVIDSLVKVFEADTANVLTVEANSQGVAVEYKNGMLGGVLIDPLDIGGTPPPAAKELANEPAPTSSSVDNHRPSSRKTIFLNPSYFERQVYADPIIAHGNAGFAKTGYDNFEVFKNEQCTIDKFTSLSAHGVVHIYSHGWAWPNENDIQEVFLMTGELASTATTTKYFSEVRAGRLPIVVYGSHNRYFISPSFVARHNDFHDDTTFVYLGFCYGWLGSWRDSLIEVSGAAACVSFDWSVYTSWNSAWAQHLYNDLCDTSKSVPMELGFWRDHAPHIDNTYWDPGDHRWVSIWNQGYSDLVMWNALRILSVTPSEAQPGEVVAVRGVGFGTYKQTSTLVFGDLEAVTISWSDTLITAVVPQGFTNGNVVVFVGEESSNGYAFHVPTIHLTLDHDSLYQGIGDTVYVRAIVTGSTDTTVNWRVLPYGETQNPAVFSYTAPNAVRIMGGYWFAGLARVIAIAHADTTVRDTVTVAFSAMSRYKTTQFAYIRFEGDWTNVVTCSHVTYAPNWVFIAWNQNGEATSPKPVWNGNEMTIRGSWQYGEWPYHDSLYVKAVFSPLGDTIRSLQMTNYRYGRDPLYRQWEHRITATNLPYNYSLWTENYRIVGSVLTYAEVQSHVTSFYDYYLERDAQEGCWFERTCSAINWSGTTHTPRLEFKLSVFKY